MKRLKLCVLVCLAAAAWILPGFVQGSPSPRFRLPAESGTVILQSWTDESRPLIILIQDMHGNPEVQGHIYDCLEWASMSLADWRPGDQRLALAVEGASGEVPMKTGWGLENNQAKEDILNRRLQAGFLDGAERFALTHGAPVWMFGAETTALYEAAQSRISLFFNTETQRRLQELQQLILEQAGKKLRGDLLKLDILYYRSLVQGDSADVIAQAIRQWAGSRRRRVWDQVWIGKAGLPLRQRLDAVFQALALDAASDPEKEFLAQQRYCWELDQMAWLAAAPEGAGQVASDCLEHQGKAGQQAYRYFQSLSSGKVGKIPLSEADFLALATQLSDFYSLNRQRDKAFVENILANLAKRGWQNAVLVAGGFHAAGITGECQSRGLNFVVIRPAGEERAGSPAYYDLLRLQIRSNRPGH